MAAILDSLVPARRREKRRIMALEERLHARWGDPSISAPTQGGWTAYKPNAADMPPSKDVSAPSHSALASPDGPRPVREQQPDADRQLASLKLTIPLPWYNSKKSYQRSSSLTQESSQVLHSDQGGTLFDTQDMTTSPTPVVYKPASQEYRKELDAMVHSANPTRTTSPAILYKPVSEEYKKALDHMAIPSTQSKTPFGSTSEDLGTKQHVTTDEAKYDRPMRDPTRPHTSHNPETSSDINKSIDESNADTSTASSPSVSSNTKTDTPQTATSPASEDVVKGMADVGLSPSPRLRQEKFGRSSSYGPSRQRTYRESTSSSSSEGSSISSPLGLQNATMPSGGYYASLAGEYKQIAKTVEEAAVAEYGRKLFRNSAQPSTNGRTRGGSLERPAALAKDYGRNLSWERHRDQSLERISEGHNREKVRTPAFPKDPGQTAFKDRHRDPSLDRISETHNHEEEHADRSAQGRSERDRNFPVDRARTGSKERSRNVSQEQVRGKSVESSRALLKERAISEERVLFAPQELVPEAEDLWG